MTVDFAFEHVRVISAGAAEAVPAVTDSIVWDLREAEGSATHTPPEGLLMLATGADLAYEIGIWDATTTSGAAWVVVGTGTLTAGAPTVVQFPYAGARVYIRSTGVTAVNITLSCKQVITGPTTVTVGPITTANGALETTQLLVNGHVTTIDTSTAAINGKLPTAAAAADASSNATLLSAIVARLEGYNGTTWDMLRTAITTATSTFTGVLNDLPLAIYKLVDPTLTDGQAHPLTTDASGWLRATLHSYDSASGTNKSIEMAPLNEQYTTTTLVDTTNVATGTYYPSSSGASNGGIRDASITGTLIDGAAETTTLTVEVSNFGGTTATDWHTVYFYEGRTNANVASVSATNQTTYFAISLDNIGAYAYRRYLITTSASTNTVKIIENVKAL